MMSRAYSSKSVVWGSVTALLLFCIAIFILPTLLKRAYTAEDADVTQIVESTATSAPAFIVTHVPTPEPMKAIYMTACVAATPSWRTELKKFVEDTELNSIMIDIKDYSGTISIVDEKLQANDATGCKIKDLAEFIGELHESGIYVIGRITVFQDPYYAERHPDLAVKSKSTGGTWRDKKGLAFIDVGAEPYWDYMIKLAKESYELGFDELNFDYIRYPSDGNMQDTRYSWTVGTSTKAEMLESFFSYLHNGLKDTGMKTSADLFGLTTLSYDDLGIGQVLERALPYFDYIYPMTYPSHYAWNTGGFGDPATHPYEIMKFSMDSAVAREQAFNTSRGLATSTPSKLRPWIQDFDLGAQYGMAEVQAQIKATYDSGLTGWLSWDAANRYTREAYLPE
jgi:hypothetical protein